MHKLFYSLLIVSLMLPGVIFAVTISPNAGIINSSNNDLVNIIDYAEGATSSLYFYNTDTGFDVGTGGTGVSSVVGSLADIGIAGFPLRIVGTFECFNDFNDDYCLFDYSFTPAGNYSAIELDSSTGCNGLNYTQCLGVGSFVSEALWFMRDSVMFSVPTSTVDSLTATITDAFADPGLLLVIVLAAGLPLAFWAIRRVIGLIPKGR